MPVPVRGERAEIKARLDEHGFELVLFALAYADVLGTRQIHVMAGVQPNDAQFEACLEVYRENLELACRAARSAGRLLLIEPINTRDIPGYLLNTPEEATPLIEALGQDCLKLQFDFYHTQIMGGDLAKRFVRHQPLVAHVQIAGVPERHEPDTGEVNYPCLLALLDRLG